MKKLVKPIKVIVTGADGQLGRSINSVKNLSDDIVFKFKNKTNLDITNFFTLDDFFLKNEFDVIINCAAYTAVDMAEKDHEKAFEINKSGVENLAKIGKKHNIFIIHVSTDYVFEGTKEDLYVEEDETYPLNIYGISKLEGEKMLKKFSSRYMIIRVSWLYSEFGQNFFKTIIKKIDHSDELSIVFDQIGSPTYAVELSTNIVLILKKMRKYLLKKEFKEIFHYANTGTTSWHGFASEISRNINSSVNLKKINTSSLNLPAARPKNSGLDSFKIQKFFGIKIKTWQDSLLTCLSNYKDI
jgi:dTDP-4-dehydrorhamnose reductase